MSNAIRAWLARAEGYPTPSGQQGWVIKAPELNTLLGECTPHVSASVVPCTTDDGDLTTFHIRLALSFSRAELDAPMEGQDVLDFGEAS